MSLELLNTYEKGHLSSNQFYEQLLINYGSPRDISLETFKTYWEDMLFPNQDSIDFLQRASRDYPVWLLSNTNDFHYDILIKHFPFMQWIQGGTYSFMVGSMKPELKIYQEALQASGFHPAEALFIDDLEVNVLAARDVGFHAIQYQGYADLERVIRKQYPELEYLL